MIFSTRGCYGTGAILDLALHEKKSPVLLKDIAKKQNIS
jgi:DNA-binding IscR family transcriptional regulator